ncbi:keratin, type I cytoskeletal 9-like [Scaptodrosophila lebanonensis]|uniref:Keratin, type I cytoskeletal 9-like n=1 Tax=Drosophila lebanonensis TaxID=7225 RepID=A0A6J2U7J2_DROLE|nr:keratin, type I cytoskeletal 9-like [Scaptodrosophila lebanonensis]
MEPALRRKQPCPCWDSMKRRWFNRNRGVIQQLAKALNKPDDDAFEFLWQLTLSNFSKVLNPKGAGWNWCRVPLTRVDTCDLYGTIFDLNGNLRSPIEPASLFKLLELMNYFLNPAKDRGAKDAGIFGRKRRKGSKKGKLNGNSSSDRFSGSFAAGFSNTPGGQAFGMGGGLFGPGGPFRGGAFGAGPGFGWGGLFGGTYGAGYGWAPGGFGHSGRHGHGHGRGDHGYGRDDRYGKRMGDPGGRPWWSQNVPDGKGNGSKNNSNRGSAIGEISDLYNNVMDNKHKREILTSNQPPNEDQHKPRRFLGQSLPVAVHEPFNKARPWTWVRRDPRQTRLLVDGTLGRNKVKRYRRESVQQAYEEAKKRYSVRSNYSVGSKSVKSAPMFGKEIKKGNTAKRMDYKRMQKMHSRSQSSLASLSQSQRSTHSVAKKQRRPHRVKK